MVAEDIIRKGPWTEQEDFRLVYFVALFGDRRWDFIAKVSGLNRTGKSCRLRWVNYLHPDLKRGKMTPQEERLVLELHSKWGNRWSRIARKLPGRTDNEIKNYWRTHLRKQAQEKKKNNAMSPSSSSSNGFVSSASKNPTVDSHPLRETGAESFYDTGGNHSISADNLEGKKKKQKKNMIITSEEDQKAGTCFSMDDIWNDIDFHDHDHHDYQSIEKPLLYFNDHGSCEEDQYDFTCPPMVSPTYDYGTDSLWRMDDIEEESYKTFNNQPITTTNPLFFQPYGSKKFIH